MDPPVSDPSATAAVPCATAAAEPPLDPPGTRSCASGLRTGPNAEFSFDDPMANSSQLVLPKNGRGKLIFGGNENFHSGLDGAQRGGVWHERRARAGDGDDRFGLLCLRQRFSAI